jgi:hypothetical protein
MKKLTFLCCLALPASAGLLYNNTNLTDAVTGIGPITTCGPSGCTPGIGITFDDVLVPLARDPGGLPLNIQEVAVGIGGIPGDDVTFALWSFPLLADGSPTVPPQQIATAEVLIGPSGFQNITFGDNSSTLLTVQPNLTANPGYGLFYLGLSASTVADWSWANGPDFNLPTAYFYNAPTNQIFLDTSPPGFPSNLSYAIEIHGTPVPESPSMVTLLALCSVLLVRRGASTLHTRLGRASCGFRGRFRPIAGR